MAIHFVADLHFNGDSARHAHPHGFADSAEMTRRICEVWTARVAPVDTVWIIGNVGNPIHLAALPGIKHLVRGPGDAPAWSCLATGRYASVSDRHWLETPQGFVSLIADPRLADFQEGVMTLHGGISRGQDGFISVSAEASGWGPIGLDAIIPGGFAEPGLRQAA